MNRLILISSAAICVSFVAVSARADERVVNNPTELVNALKDMATNSNVRLITLREGVYDLTTITAMSANGLLDLSMKAYTGNPVIQGDPTVTRDKIVLDAKETGRILNLPFGDYAGHIMTLRNLTFRNGKVTGDTSTGGAINMSRWGRVNVTNCAFYCNVAGKQGGAIGGTLADLYCYDCQFETNKLNNGSGAGGAVVACKGLYDCVFRKNTCTGGEWAGAATCQGSVKRCTFDSNSVPGHWGYYGAGALLVSGSGTVDGCTFTNNSFTGSLQGNGGGGGALYLKDFTGKVLNGKFYDNSVGAGKYGGAIYGGGADAVISNCTFRGNTATANSNCRGGAIAQSSARIDDCVFEANSGSYGGGVWKCPNVRNCFFARNRSTYEDGNNGGGAGYESSFYSCVITNNSSVYQCGGVYGCKVYNSYLADNRADKTAANQEAGDSYFEDCTFNGRRDGSYQAAYFMNCRFNRSTFDAFDTQYLFGGSVAATNCLFTGIKTSGLCSISTAAGATLVNCTVASNDYAQLFRFAPSFAAGAKGVAVNVFCYENRNTAGGWRQDDIGETDSQTPCLTNCCLRTVKTFDGTGNLNYYNNPTLESQIKLMTAERDPDHPYAPRRRSVLNGAGLVQDWMADAKDLAGQDRLTAGAVAIGAYETTDRGPIPGLMLLFR